MNSSAAVLDLSNKSLATIHAAKLSLSAATTELNLAFNAMESLDPILVGSCPSLCRLNVAHNRLSRLPELSALRFLVRLDLSHNLLASLAGLAGCLSLEELWVPHNRLDLAALTELAASPGLPGLRTLVACNNPADKVRPQGLAAALLLHMLPGLDSIDARKCGAGPERRQKLALLSDQVRGRSLSSCC